MSGSGSGTSEDQAAPAAHEDLLSVKGLDECAFEYLNAREKGGVAMRTTVEISDLQRRILLAVADSAV